MDWKQLLESGRLGDPGTGPQTMRNEFQRDFDRLVFSTMFRRMNGKTQVFPLPGSDTTHSRLTHSLEVSSVGRSLGSLIGQQLPGCNHECTAAVVAAASVAHDVGNPPFGHSGEAASADFFHSSSGRRFLEGLTEAEVADFTRFEGNALGFRLLTRTNPRQSNWKGGLQLTFATLGAFSKYPRPSLPKGRDSIASEKKFGYFQSEAGLFDEISLRLGLIPRPDCGWCRHPLAFLMEAADDICYHILDLEDGFRLNLVSYEHAEHLLRGVADLPPSPVSSKTFNGILDPRERVGYLRAKAINNLVSQVASVFIASHTELLEGRYDKPLLADSPSQPAIDAMKEATHKLIYPHRPVIEIEAAGYRVLGGLLEDFLGAACEHPRSKRSEKIISL